MNCKTWTAALGLVLVLAGATGCIARFQRETFEMITVGADDRYDVEEILGEPVERANDDRIWRYWELGSDRFACIEFDASGRVIRKFWEPIEEKRAEPEPRTTGT